MSTVHTVCHLLSPAPLSYWPLSVSLWLKLSQLKNRDVKLKLTSVKLYSLFELLTKQAPPPLTNFSDGFKMAAGRWTCDMRRNWRVMLQRLTFTHTVSPPMPSSSVVDSPQRITLLLLLLLIHGPTWWWHHHHLPWHQRAMATESLPTSANAQRRRTEDWRSAAVDWDWLRSVCVCPVFLTLWGP